MTDIQRVIDFSVSDPVLRNTAGTCPIMNSGHAKRLPA